MEASVGGEAVRGGTTGGSGAAGGSGAHSGADAAAGRYGAPCTVLSLSPHLHLPLRPHAQRHPRPYPYAGVLEQEVRRVTEAATAAGVVQQLARHHGEMPREQVRAAARHGGGGGARRAARARSARGGGSAAAAAGQKGKGRGLSLTSHMAEPARKEGAAALTEVFG